MKETRGPTFVSEPQIQHLVELLEDIHRGYLQVPRFHRPFVWDLEQRLELMRSIRDGLPIGTITLWRTHSVRIATYDRLGPHSQNVLPSDNQPVRQYLLDGVQRLTTLYGALYPPAAPQSLSDAGAESFSIYYNLESEDFVTPRQELIGPYHLPLSVLLNSVELLRFHRSLRGKEPETWFERADEIFRAFRGYKIPIIPIATDDLEMATRAFQRLNIQGTLMSEIHMVNALTWTSRFDLVAQVGELKEQTLNSHGWGDLNDDLLLKTCKLALGLDIQEESVEKLSERIKARPQVLQESVSNIERGALFLAKHCRIERPSVLPYSFQLVLLAEAFRQDPSPDESTLLLLRDWFWMTTYGELFAGVSGGRLQRVLDELMMNLKRKMLTWPGATPFRRRPLGSRFDMLRGARGRALALRLVDARPLDSSGEEIPAPSILARESAKALVHLVSRNELPEDQADLYASPANRLLVRPEDAPAIRKLLLEGSVSKEFLRSHIISPGAHKALRQGNPEKFLQLRMKEFDALEEQFIAPIVQQLSRKDEEL
jgi:hypothetical protein